MWEAPTVNRDLIGYNVYQDEEQIHYAEGPANTSFFDMGLESGTYTYYVTSVYDQSESEPSEPVEVVIGTAVDDDNTDLALPYLAQNYPNPFNSSTSISFFSHRDTENIKINIYNMKGQLIKKISIPNDQSSIIWNGTNENNDPVPSGIYFYKLSSGEYTDVKKMILMR